MSRLRITSYTTKCFKLENSSPTLTILDEERYIRIHNEVTCAPFEDYYSEGRRLIDYELVVKGVVINCKNNELRVTRGGLLCCANEVGRKALFVFIYCFPFLICRLLMVYTFNGYTPLGEADLSRQLMPINSPQRLSAFYSPSTSDLHLRWK